MSVKAIEVCNTCHKQPPAGRYLMICFHCRTTKYCSQQCQIDDYPRHGTICSKEMKFVNEILRQDIDRVCGGQKVIALISSLAWHWAIFDGKYIRCIIRREENILVLMIRLCAQDIANKGRALCASTNRCRVDMCFIFEQQYKSYSCDIAIGLTLDHCTYIYTNRSECIKHILSRTSPATEVMVKIYDNNEALIVSAGDDIFPL